MINDFEKEYREFLNSEGKIPSGISEKIIETVHRDLNPPSYLVFGKIFLIHLVMGSISLFGCPQFGLTPSGSMGVMGLLMKFGDTVCAMGCGAFFIFGTVVVSSLLLRPEEFQALKRTGFVQVFGLTILSTLGFLLFGAKVTVAWILFWALGVGLFGTLGFGITWGLRRRAY